MKLTANHLQEAPERTPGDDWEGEGVSLLEIRVRWWDYDAQVARERFFYATDCDVTDG